MAHPPVPCRIGCRGGTRRSRGRRGTRRAAEPPVPRAAPPASPPPAPTRPGRSGAPRASPRRPEHGPRWPPPDRSQSNTGEPSTPTTVMPGRAPLAAGRLGSTSSMNAPTGVADLDAQALEGHLARLVLRVDHQLEVELSVLLLGLGSEERRRGLHLHLVVEQPLQHHETVGFDARRDGQVEQVGRGILRISEVAQMSRSARRGSPPSGSTARARPGLNVTYGSGWWPTTTAR
jgi:hypothetical protein